MFKKKDKDSKQTLPVENSPDTRRSSISSFVNFARRGSSKSQTGLAAPIGNELGIPNASDYQDKDFIKSLPPIIKALFQEDYEKFQDLISKKKADLLQVDKKCNRNLFHWCAILQKYEYVKRVVDTKSKDILVAVNNMDNDGRSPLCLAVISKSRNIVNLYLNESRAQINSKDKFGKTCLYYSIYNNDGVMCQILIQNGADKNQQTFDAPPLLIEAIQKQQYDAALSLINMNCTLDQVDHNGRTALHNAVIEQNYDICLALLQRNIMADFRDSSGLTALDYARDSYFDFRQDLQSAGENESNNYPAVSIFRLLERYFSDHGLQPAREHSNGSGVDILAGENHQSQNDQVPIYIEPPEGQSQSQTLSRLIPSTPKIVVQSHENSRVSLVVPDIVTNSEDGDEEAVIVFNPLSRRNSMTLNRGISVSNKLQTIAQSGSSQLLGSSVKSSMNEIHVPQLPSDSVKSSGDDLFNDRSQQKVYTALDREHHRFVEEVSDRLSTIADPRNSDQLEEENQKLKSILSDISSIFKQNDHAILAESQDIVENPSQLTDHLQKVFSKQTELSIEILDLKGQLDQLKNNASRTQSIDIEQIRNDLQIAQDKLKSQEKDVLGYESMKAMLNKLTIENQVLEKKFSDAEQQIQKLDAKNVQFQSQVSQMAKNLQEKEIAYSDLEAENLEEKSKFEKLLVESSIIKKSNIDLQKKLDLLNNVVEQSKNVINPLQLAEFVNKIKLQEDEIAKLNQSIIQQQVEFQAKEQSLQRELESGNQKIVSLRKEVTEKERIYDEAIKLKAQNRNSTHESLNSITEEPFTSKEQLYSELSAELSAVQHRLNLEVAAKKSMEMELNKIQNDMLKVKQEYQQKQNQEIYPKQSTTEVQIEYIQEEKLLLEKRLTELTQKVQEYHFKIDDDQRLIQTLNNQIKDYQETIDKNSNLIQDLEKKFQLVSSQSQMDKQELQSKIDEISYLNEQILILKSSSENQIPQYLNLLESQLQSEKENYSQLLKDHTDAHKYYSQIQIHLDQLQSQILSQNQQYSQIKAQNEALIKEIDSHKYVLSVSKAKISSIEDQLFKSQQSELDLKRQLNSGEFNVTEFKEKEKAMDMAMAHMTNDLQKQKNLLLDVEKQLYEANQKLITEQKAFQQQIKDKQQSVENRDKLLQKAKDEFELLKNEISDLSKKLKDQEQSFEEEMQQQKTKYTDQVERYNQVMKTKLNLEFKLADATKKLDTAQSIPQQTQEVSTEVSEKYEILKQEYEKLAESTKQLQKKYSKAEIELKESIKALTALNAIKRDLESDKVLLTSESASNKSEINEFKKQKQQMDDAISQLLQRAEDAFNVQLYQSHEKRKKLSLNLDDLSSDAIIQKLETIWDDVDEIVLILKSFNDVCINYTKSTQLDTSIQKSFVKLINLFSNSLENQVAQRIMSILDNAAEYHSRLLSNLIKQTKIHASSVNDSTNLKQLQSQLQSIELVKTQLSSKNEELMQQLRDEKQKVQNLQTTMDEIVHKVATELPVLENKNLELIKRNQELESKLVQQVNPDGLGLNDTLLIENRKLKDDFQRLKILMSKAQNKPLKEDSILNLDSLSVKGGHQGQEQYFEKLNNTIEQLTQRLSAAEKEFKSLSHQYKSGTYNYNQKQKINLNTFDKILKESNDILAEGLDGDDLQISQAQSAGLRKSIKKLIKLQESRYKLDQQLIKSERKLVKVQEQEKQEILDRFNITLIELEKITALYNSAREQIFELKNQLSQFKLQQASRSYAKNRLEEQLSEVKGLLAYKNKFVKEIKEIQ